MKQIGVSANGCPRCKAWSTSIIGYTKSGEEKLRCGYCEHTFSAPPHSGFAHLSTSEKVRYPLFNGSLGQVVTSRAHENHLAAKMGMVPTDQRTFNKGTTPKSTRKKLFKAAKV